MDGWGMSLRSTFACETSVLRYFSWWFVLFVVLLCCLEGKFIDYGGLIGSKMKCKSLCENPVPSLLWWF